MVAQNVFHRASSHQIIDLWRFADRCNIPQNLPTNFQSDLIATIQQRCFPLPEKICALLFQQSHVFLICVVLTYNEWFQERSSQALPNSKELSVQMTLGFLSGSRNFCKLLGVSCEVFVLHGYDWIHWVVKSCTTTAYRWLFRDSQPSLITEDFVICCNQITKNFCTRYDFANTSSAQCPCDFLADLAISVFREVSINSVFHPNPHFS